MLKKGEIEWWRWAYFSVFLLSESRPEPFVNVCRVSWRHPEFRSLVTAPEATLDGKPLLPRELLRGDGSQSVISPRSNWGETRVVTPPGARLRVHDHGDFPVCAKARRT
jgi:hypothetical protein